MATIQLKRQLKFGHPKEDAIEYIKNKLTMVSGEPLLCTYKNGNGKWGAIEVICVFPIGTERSAYPMLEEVGNNKFDSENKLKENIIKINDNLEWETI